MPLASSARLRSAAVLGGDQPRKHLEPAAADDVVVVAAAELHAAVLDDAQPPPLRAVFRVQLLEQHHAVRDALHLQVVLGRGQVVEQQHRAVAASAKNCFSARIWRR